MPQQNPFSYLYMVSQPSGASIFSPLALLAPLKLKAKASIISLVTMVLRNPLFRLISLRDRILYSSWRDCRDRRPLPRPSGEKIFTVDSIPEAARRGWYG